MIKEIAWWNESIFTEAIMSTCNPDSRDDLFSAFRERSQVLAVTYKASQKWTPVWSPTLPTDYVLPHWLHLCAVSWGLSLAVTSAWGLLPSGSWGGQLLLPVHPKLVWRSRLMAAHALRGGMKRFCIHIRSLSEESRQAPKLVHWTWVQRGEWLWILLWLGCGGLG